MFQTNQELTETIQNLEKSQKKYKEKLAGTNKLLEEFKAEVGELKDRLLKKEDEMAKLNENHSSILKCYESTLQAKSAEV